MGETGTVSKDVSQLYPTTFTSADHTTAQVANPRAEILDIGTNSLRVSYDTIRYL